MRREPDVEGTMDSRYEDMVIMNQNEKRSFVCQEECSLSEISINRQDGGTCGSN